MLTLILIIIYAAFISLGLPDGMLGAAWPTMQAELGVPLGYAGLISLTISAGTIISSLLSVKVLKRFGTGKVVMASVLLTACGLLGFSLTSVFWIFFFFAVPLGIGAGAVDSALNEYIAEHYKASHMNFLHSFWGIGAMSGPLIMSMFIKNAGTWRPGYLIVSIIQFILVAVFFLSLPLWKKADQLHAIQHHIPDADQSDPVGKDLPATKKSFLSGIRVKGVKGVLVCFMMYTGMELTLGLWGATYLVHVLSFTPSRAAAWVSLYYGGITLGRFLSGFLSMKFSNKQLIRTGEISILLGACSLLAGYFIRSADSVTLAAFILIGLGCAPVFPGMLHETPVRFGKQNAQAIMGFQMAVAYSSSAILPPLFGLVATAFSPALLPLFIAAYASILFALSERSNTVFAHVPADTLI